MAIESHQIHLAFDFVFQTTDPKLLLSSINPVSNTSIITASIDLLLSVLFTCIFHFDFLCPGFLHLRAFLIIALAVLCLLVIRSFTLWLLCLFGGFFDRFAFLSLRCLRGTFLTA